MGFRIQLPFGGNLFSSELSSSELSSSRLSSSELCFRPSQLKVKQADPIEGEFCLVKSKNYQAFLAAIGTVVVVVVVVEVVVVVIMINDNNKGQFRLRAAERQYGNAGQGGSQD